MNKVVVMVLVTLVLAQPASATTSLLAQIPPSARYVAIDGGLPTAVSQLKADIVDGPHWIAYWTGDLNQAPQFLRAADASATTGKPLADISIAQDASAPTAQLTWADQDGIERIEPKIVGPQFKPTLRAQDSSGVGQQILLVDGQLAADNWAAGLVAGNHSFSANIEDALGNHALVELGQFSLDMAPPKLTYSVLDVQGQRLRNGVGKAPYWVDVFARDEGELATITLVDGGAVVCSGTQSPLRCTIQHATVDLTAQDSAGNRSHSQLILQVDDQGPTFALSKNNTAITIERRVKLSVGEKLELSASDSAGVTRGCARLNGDHCSDFPVLFIAKTRGRYRIAANAVDAFNNQSQLKIDVEVRE
jgi:hypothetical protein